MPRDPFLSAHLIGNKCFEVGGEFSPASIRDQMVRAYLLVDRAFQAKLISAGRELLVVGAGPSGLTAAVRAAQLGVPTTVVEKRAKHAFLLGRCTSRDVEPTLYDWPVDHWTQDIFEWSGPPMPFRWRSGRANLVALNWQRRLTRLLAAHPGLIAIPYNTTVGTTGGLPPIGRSGMVEVDLLAGGRSVARSFGALISCIGFGQENCRLGAYSGFEFWQTDDLEKPDCGLSFSPRVLISGGGDGALQDFVRVMTLRSTRRAFDGVLRAFARFPWLFDSVQSDIQSAEDVASRALSWNLPQHDDPVFERLEDAHMAVIRRLRSTRAWPVIDMAVRQMIPNPTPRVDLVHAKPFFTQCYALNRFLALLIFEVLSAGSVQRRHDMKIIDIQGAHPHSCAGSAQACHGQPHEVTFATPRGQIRDVYDVVVLRHGILGPRHLFTSRRPGHLRQLLPFFVDV